jgi:hypothetical protein
MLNLKNQKRHSRVLIATYMTFIFIVTCAVGSSVVHGQSCQPRGPISFTFRPEFLGDSMTVGVSLSPCETVALTETHNMGNDSNRGTNVKMTYLNGSGQVLHSEQFWGFLSGGNSFPTAAPWPFPWRGTVSANWTVASLKVESITPYGKGASNQAPEYEFTLTFGTRPGYNTAGDTFGTAANATLPSTYRGSFYDSTDTPPDPGQFFKVRLRCRQAMYVHGSATGSTQTGAIFRIEIYDANQSLVNSSWILLNADGTETFASSPFTNPNNTDADFYIRLKSTLWPIYDFTLNIDEYTGSNSSTNPRTVAPDATGTGGSVSSEEYRLPATVDSEILTPQLTELWAKVYWPTDFSGGPYPLAVFLHGNHATCGRSSNPRIDDNSNYTFTGTCPSAPFLGVAPFIDGVPPIGAARNNFTGWVGMRINVGARPIVVQALGRLFVPGTASSHDVKIIRVSDQAQIALGTVTKDPQVPFNAVSYVPITPVTLSANTQYFVVSQETSGQDFWYDSQVVPASTISSAAATLTGAVTSIDGTNWIISTIPARQTNGPVDFLYDFTDGSGYSVVPNHLGYEYLANQLASRGYIVTSINANRSITSGLPDHPDDPTHIFSRGRLVLKHLETLRTWNNGATAFVTGKTLGTLRNDSSGWYGMQISVGPQPITVHALGRLFAAGNTGTHTVKIVKASDNTEVANVSIPMSGGTTGTFKYENLASPVTLAANTSYYIASEETAAGDSWYDSNTSISWSVLATVNGRVSSADGTNWTTQGAAPPFVYGPLDFKFQVLSVNLTNKIDFSNVGLMGHSRGGQGVRAAYNLYRDPSIDSRGTNISWSSKIPGMSIKGIFEIAPTDNPLPTAPGGTGVRYLNADGTAWNVLLPMCDGDVFNLSGVRAFDRIMPFTGTYAGIAAENPAKQKSTFTVWGTNHNFFNTEWQRRDPFADPSQSACSGSDNNAIFPEPVTDGSGSAEQRTTASASLLAFFRANVGAGADSSFNRNLNPLYNLPPVVTSLTRTDRGFTVSPSSTITKIVFDFIDPALNPPYPDPPLGTSHDAVNTQFSYGVIGDHDYATNVLSDPEPTPPAQLLRVGHITWSGSSDCNTYFQANWKNPGSGDSISSYKTLDFRVTRRHSLQNPPETNFQIQLIKSDGTPTGAAVSLKKYLKLIGPVGVNLQINGQPETVLHPIFQTVRIPLTDFTGASLSSIRGVRFVFSDTPSGAISLANIRLSNVN